MPRKKREESATGIYHWIARGVNRKDLFRQKNDYTTFLEFLALFAHQKKNYDSYPKMVVSGPRLHNTNSIRN